MVRNGHLTVPINKENTIVRDYVDIVTTYTVDQATISDAPDIQTARIIARTSVCLATFPCGRESVNRTESKQRSLQMIDDAVLMHLFIYNNKLHLPLIY